jgi:hypothetical protein
MAQYGGPWLMETVRIYSRTFHSFGILTYARGFSNLNPALGLLY